ncbi:MAG: Ig-like domain-containing protein [Terriglobales bacterium]
MGKAVKLLITILVLAGASFAVSVSVATPTNGATVASPVNIKASASSGYPITGWHIYVDGVKAYSGGMASSISASVPLASGIHNVIVRAWDSTGAYASQALQLTAGAVSSGTVAVSVTSPANGASVVSPATITATTSSAAPVTGWRVYVDGTEAYAAGATSTISVPVNLSTGTHQVVVRAWNSTGAYGSANLTLSAGGTSTSPTPTPPTGAGPMPPSYAAVYKNVENMQPTGKCSSASCSGGPAVAWNYWAAPYQTTPSLDGASSVYYINGPSYGTALWWYRVGNNPAPTRFIYEFWLYTDSAAPTTAEALEFDLIQVANGRKYNFSSQCNYWTKTWDTWNEATQHWIHSNAVCQPFKPNTWHHVKWALERVGTQTHYLSVTVDGVTQNISSAYAWQPAPATSWANGALVFQVQQDLNGRGGSFKQWVDKATVWAW